MNTTSAKVVFSFGQFFVMTMISIVIWISLYFKNKEFIIVSVVVISALFFISVLFRSWVGIRGLFAHNTILISNGDVDGLRESELPIYTILLPAYKEKNIIKKLVRSIIALDYPAEKLDVKILLEQDDEDTYSQLVSEPLPAHFEIIRIPDSLPKTKPKACNRGLEKARGKYVVIYDAEDIPDRDQLKKAIIAFTRVPDEVICLQAKLNFYNSHQNIFTKLFTLDYSAWFDIYLPGLCAIHSPIPLGGTSNHFRTNKLKEIGGWDPYNVTEDCDVGMRIARHKLQTRILDSTTLEEATPTFSSWFKQRTRWSKGYMQTYLLNIRRPLHSIKEFGLAQFMKMNVVVGLQIATSFLAPTSFLAIIIFFYYFSFPETPQEFVLWIFTISMILFNVFFVCINAFGAYIRKNNDLIPYALLMPLYWLCIGFANWRAFFQLFLTPHFWEKTPHGLQDAQAESYVKSKRNSMFVGIHHTWYGTLLLGTAAAYLFVSLFVVCLSPLEYTKFFYFAEQNLVTKNEITLEKSFIGYDTLSLKLRFTIEKESQKNESFHYKVYLKTLDGYWYDYKIENPIPLSTDVELKIPLDSANWVGRNTTFKYGPWMLRRVRSLGVEMYGNDTQIKSFSLDDATLTGAQNRNNLTVKEFNIPEHVDMYSLFEGHFRLSMEYDNPFDPSEVNAMVTIIKPDGTELTFPAFYAMDYGLLNSTCQKLADLPVQETPYWAFRYTPETAGTYSWFLNITDTYGNAIKTKPKHFIANAQITGEPKVVTKKLSRYFHYDGGDIFFPTTINIAWPVDENDRVFSSKVSQNKDTSKIFQDYVLDIQKYGGNVARVWLSPWWGGLEWDKSWPYFQGLGEYNLKNAADVDCLLADASRKNIYVELTLAPQGEFKTNNKLWQFSPFNSINGGPVSSGESFFEDAQSEKFFKNRLRYVAARYGAYNSVFGWVFINEITSIFNNEKIIVDWYQKNVEYIKSVDSGHHLVSFSMLRSGGFDFSKINNIDYGQASAYNEGKGIISIFNEVLHNDGNFIATGKPFIISEYGGSFRGGSEHFVAREIHDGVWYSLSKPLSATPSPWWWNFVLTDHLLKWSHLFNTFQNISDLKDSTFTYFDEPVYSAQVSSSAFNLNIAGRKTKTSAQFWVYSPEKTNFTLRQVNHTTGNDYFKIIPEDFNPISDGDPGSLFPNTLFDEIENKSLTISIDGFADGMYVVEYWDTWTTVGKMSEVQIKSKNGVLHVPLFKINRDIAIKIKKM